MERLPTTDDPWITAGLDVIVNAVVLQAATYGAFALVSQTTNLNVLTNLTVAFTAAAIAVTAVQHARNKYGSEAGP